MGKTGDLNSDTGVWAAADMITLLCHLAPIHNKPVKENATLVEGSISEL
jgi:hypothetical protein